MANCDGSGSSASVREDNAERLLRYIINKTNTNKFVDFGTGLGYLPKIAHDLKIANVIGVEGNKELFDKIDCPPEVKILADVSSASFSLTTKFELSTSFELIEHIPRKLQKQLWQNLSSSTNKHLCSIHTKNDEHDLHPVVISRDMWEKFFKVNGIRFEYLYDFPLKSFDCSDFWFLDFTNVTVDIDIRALNRV